MKKISQEIYTDLFNAYVAGMFVPYEGGYHFTSPHRAYAGELPDRWKIIRQVYPQAIGFPESTRDIPELKEFCDMLDTVASSPLVKALA